MRLLCCCFLILFQWSLSAQEMLIGIFTANTIHKIEFSYDTGSYSILGDGKNFGSILPNEFVSIAKTNEGKLELKHGVRLIGKFKKVELKPNGGNRILRVHPISPELKTRKYQDGFIITPKKTGVQVVNKVSINHYLMGVVESEGGGGKHIEYYKAQAVISRTYALKHQNKHAKEGFHLCDQVHCQAYHSMMRFTPTIEEAVNLTTGEFMVDTLTNKLVDGYFHANCGGETSRSDYVWNTNVSYLQPFKDTFCIHTRQANWEHKIPKVEWRNYLVNQFNYPIEDSNYRNTIYSFDQLSRKAFYQSPHLGIPLRDIRYHFKLRSTFFSTYPEGDYVILKGRGYGHGIGMCQEGAMGMANKGLNYHQILSYYFDGIRIENKFREKYMNQFISEPFYEEEPQWD